MAAATDVETVFVNLIDKFRNFEIDDAVLSGYCNKRFHCVIKYA